MTSRDTVLDTETTGLNQKKDRLLEIAAIRFNPGSGETFERFHALLSPGIRIPPEATAIHGITNEAVADRPLFKDIAEELQDFLTGAILVAHNAPFDLGFLDAEFKRVKMGRISERLKDVVCTRRMANYVRPQRPATLNSLCDDFGISRAHRALHSAMADCELLLQVYPRLLPLHRAKEEIIEGLLPFGLDSELPADLGTLARGYVALAALMNRLKAEQKRIKPMIEQMANREDLSGDGWQIEFTERPGRMDYKAMIEELLPDTDLSPYCGETSTVAKIAGNYPVDEDDEDAE